MSASPEFLGYGTAPSPAPMPEPESIVAPTQEDPATGEPGMSGAPGARGARGGHAMGSATVPTVSGDALKFIAMIFVLIVLYDVVTHGTAWSGVFANISSHLTNFISVKPLATVQTTTAAWSNVL